MNLCLRECLVDFGDGDELFHFDDFPCNCCIDGLVDCSHALAQTKRDQYRLELMRQTDGGSNECDFEEGHFRNWLREIVTC